MLNCNITLVHVINRDVIQNLGTLQFIPTEQAILSKRKTRSLIPRYKKVAI